MATLSEVAKYIRSKVAGPFWVTVDIFFDDETSYNTVKTSKKFSPNLIAEAYGVNNKNVKLFYMDNIKVIKFSYPRPKPEGHRYENDMHSGQQYVLVADVEV